MSEPEHYDARVFTFRLREDQQPYTCVDVRAGRRTTEHIIPPAGEKYAFDVPRWPRHVEVVISPTGKSVRVFVDGKEVPK